MKKNGAQRLPPEVAPLRLFGQDIGPEKFAMTRMNAVIHDMEAEVALSDTMARPAFTEAGGALRRFDRVTANPMWNQKFGAATYENDPYGRFTGGIPPTSSADWGWVQHMAASLDGGGKRRKLHPGEILLVNGSKQFSKGRPKNYLEEAHIAALADAYLRWRAVDDLSAIITTVEATKNDYSLSPNRYVAAGEQAEVLPLDEAVVELREAEEELVAADRELNRVLKVLGLEK